MQRDTSPSHRVDQAVVCGQWNVVPAEYWRELEHAVIHVDPEHPKHAQWVACLVSMQAMEELGHFSFQNLCTDSCDMGPCIIMLKHDMMAADECQDNGPQNLVIVSMCIQIATDEIILLFY